MSKGRTQAQIDAASANRLDAKSKYKGKARKIMSALLVHALNEHQRFYEFLPKLFPQLGTITTKSIEVEIHNHEECKDCEHDYTHTAHKAVEFTQPQANNIDRLFQTNYPSQWQQLQSFRVDWLNSLMLGNTPNMGAPWSQAYWDMLQLGASVGYESILKEAPKGLFEFPPIPFVINGGEDFVKKIYADGYGLVSSQITLNVLPAAQETLNSALTGGLSWTEATDELQKQFGEKAYHWERLVRSEMAQAAVAGTKAQAQSLNEPSTVIKWSTSFGSVCPICAPRNGKLYELDSPDLFLPHPNCMCVFVVTFRKRQAKA